jgi:methyl-accepting chemotaxis protein
MKSLSLKARMMFVSALLFAVITTAGLTFFREMYSAGARSHRASRVVAMLETADTQFDRMTIGMRGFLLDPGNKSEWEFKENADEKAAELLESAAKEYADFPSLVEKIKLIQEYDELHMHKMEMEIASLVEQKRIDSANEFYFKRYLPTRRKMENLVNDARTLGVKTENEAQAKAEYILTTGGSLLLGITLLSLLASFYFNQRIASGVTRSIQALTEKLSTSVMSIELASKNTASASQQIATSATENASAITETLSISESGKKESDKGKNVVGRMADTMVQVADSNSRLESLIKVIEDIQSKTKVINDIVFETRLLSFNASIEAARAGVHGKGFAVVAEEVGKLAAVSGKAAEEINALLANSTHHVRDIVQTTSQRVNAARDASQQCEQVFEQMSHAMSEINRAMADMERETHHNSASSEEMANQAQTLALEARALTGLLGRLKSVVSGADQQAGSETSEMSELPAREMTFSHKSSKPNLQVVAENPYNVTGESIFRPQSGPSQEDGHSSGSNEDLVDRADARWKNSA